MAASARIDELRSKFDDHPRRYFAPLANEYRKGGDLETAIAICRTQLRHFPTHMSGHIVLGQALYESGELAESRTMFARAVELDPENIIALRHLGDIGRALGNVPDARRWYERMLEMDPLNEQIRADLASVSSGAPVRVPDPAPEVDDRPVPVEWVDGFAAEAFLPELQLPEPPPVPEVPTIATSAEFVDLLPDDLAWPPPSDPVADGEVPAAVDEVTTESPAFVDGWDAGWEVVEPAPAIDEPPSSVAGARLDAVEAAEAVEPFEALDPIVGLDLAPAFDAAADQLAHAEPVVSPAPVPELVWPSDDPEPLETAVSGAFLTETMAELCLRQGHDEQALAIYDRLIAQRPDDVALAARADGLRLRLNGAPAADDPTAAAFLEALAAQTPAPVAEADANVDAGPDADVNADVNADVSVTGEFEIASGDLPWLDVDTHDRPEPATDAATSPAARSDVVRAAEPSMRDVWAADAFARTFRSDAKATGSLLDELRASAASGAAMVTMAAPDDDALDADEGLPDVDLSFDRFFVGEPAGPSAAPAASPAASPPAIDAAPAAAPAPSATMDDDASVEDTEEDLAAFNDWLRGLRDT